MKKISIADRILDFFEKRSKAIGLAIKSLIFMGCILYVSYFAKFGVDFIQTNMPLLKTLIMGLLLPILAIVIFFIMHFSGGVDFNLKLIVLPIGLAIGGTTMGLISGLIHGFKGWLAGSLIGGVIILFTLQLYRKTKRESKEREN